MEAARAALFGSDDISIAPGGTHKTHLFFRLRAAIADVSSRLERFGPSKRRGESDGTTAHSFTEQLGTMSNLIFRALGAAQDATTRVLYGAEQATSKTSFYACVDRALGTHEEVPMSNYQGNVVVVVNVASK